jgi:dolichol-phosphate mannosyltransferase
VPTYNEQAGLEEFYARLTPAAHGLGNPYEILFVDDGSSDQTPQILRRLAERDECVKIVELSRNFGHQVALTAGYDYATGQAVISLDADCQHPPEMIGDLVARWREGYEVVRTIRTDTKGLSRLRRGLGRLVYRLIAAASGADLTDQADFRLLDRKAVEAVKAHREQARFLRGLVKTIGFRQICLPYVAERRLAGKSNYSLKQLAGMAAAGVFNFSLRPLRLAAALGAVFLAAAVTYAIACLVLWRMGITASAWLHLAMFLVAISGLQFLMLALLGEYVGRIFQQVKARPLYVVRQTVGFEGARGPADEAEEPDQQQFSVFT